MNFYKQNKRRYKNRSYSKTKYTELEKRYYVANPVNDKANISIIIM